MTRLSLVLLACLLPYGGVAALELDAVLERVMVTPPARVRFVEQRHNALFAESFELSGYLEYLEGGQMRKVIETPFEESFLVREDRVEIERHGETQVLPINRSRALRAMLGGIQAILAGDIERLQKVFRYELTGDERDWALQLTPRSRRVEKQLNALTVEGDDESVTSIRFELQGGEWHQMEIQRESVGQ